MIELIVVLIACGIAYRIAFPASKPPVFATQATARPEWRAAANVSEVVSLVAARRRLAAEEKLTPELKAAFDVIQAALEGK